MTVFPTIIDAILDVIAEAQVSGQEPAGVAMEAHSKGELPAGTLQDLVARGIREIRRTARYDEHVRFKVLKLDPGWYERAAAQQAAYENSPEGRRKRAIKERKDAEWQAKWDQRIKESHERTARALDPILRAMAFYNEWHLPDGTPLGDATRGKLLAEAMRERSIADGHLRNADFYEKLAAKVPEGTTVREAVPLDVAHQIREDAYRNTNEQLAA